MVFGSTFRMNVTRNWHIFSHVHFLFPNSLKWGSWRDWVASKKIGADKSSFHANSTWTRPAASHSIPLSTRSPVRIRINKLTNKACRYVTKILKRILPQLSQNRFFTIPIRVFSLFYSNIRLYLRK